MTTKYDIGDKVIVKAVVVGIVKHKTDKCPQYILNVYEGNANWGNQIHISENTLVYMNRGDEEERQEKE